MSDLKATDFRIGNIVQTVEHKEPRVVASLYGDSEYIEHTRIGIPMSEEGLWDDSKIEPIPLSPEVLGACVSTYAPLNNVFYFGKLRIILWPTGDIDCLWYDYELKTEIKYLHQLQNLYFALTGEELQYNPE